MRTAAACLLAITAILPSPGQTVEPRLSLAGVVKEAPSLGAVSRARIEIRPLENSSSLKATALITDARGAFEASGLPPGQYRVTASKAGYFATRLSSKTVALAPGPSQPLSLILNRLSVVAGTVFDEDGLPTTAVFVRAFRLEFIRGRPQWTTDAPPASVDEAGRFRIANLVPGRYLFTATPQNNNSGVPAGSATYGMTYHPGAADIREAVVIAVPMGAEVTADIKLLKRRVYSVSGRLIFPSPHPDPEATARLPLMNLKLAPAGTDAVLTASNFLATVFADGKFLFQNIPSGTYIIQPDYIPVHVATPQGRFTMRPKSYGSREIVVADRDVDDVVIPMQAGQTLEGAVQFDTPASGEAPAQNWERVQIRAYTERLNGPRSAAPVDQNGRFTLADLPPERVRFAVIGLPEGAYVKAAFLGQNPLNRHVLDLQAGATGPLRIVIARDGATLKGSVRNDDDQPQEGVVVSLVRRSDKGSEYPDVAVSRTDASGGFTFSALEPAEWELLAWEEIDPQHLERGAFLWRFSSRATAVKTGASSSPDEIVLKMLPKTDSDRVLNELP